MGEKCFGAHILGISLNQQFFSRCGNFIEKLNFVSTPWKTIIPLGNSVGDIYESYKSIWVGNDFFFIKVSFFENLMKKLDSGWSS